MIAMADPARPSEMRFNPAAGNKLRTRADVVDSVHQLFNPLLPMFSAGKARVQIDASTSTWDRAACDLEGFARPLFGIAPMVAGGGQFEYWDIFREGLANGTDPAHPEYWGDVPDTDQRHVEAAALAYAILLCPKDIWTPLDDIAKKHVKAWLVMSRNGKHGSNNHKYFRVLVDLALESIGETFDTRGTEEYLHDLENLYIKNGWYRDGDDPGDTHRIDYYNAFAMHYYGLFYAVHRPSDERRARRFKERAAIFAQNFHHWFADSGANVPYGRSLAYRHCVVAFWGYLAVAGVEALPWGMIKGIYMRNLRWWATQPISRQDGILTLGYAYPNQFMAERYLSPGSPYWCMKAFSPLSLPLEHPFWAAEELPVPDRREIVPFAVPGMVFMHQPQHTIMLVSGPGTKQQMRWVPEKYHKFAYSSRYGFSVESDHLGFQTGTFDSMIAFSDDGVHYRVREHYEAAFLAGVVLFSKWRPWADVEVQSWLIPSPPWHVRVHVVTSPRKLSAVEGGFAGPRADFAGDERSINPGSARVYYKSHDFSGIIDSSMPPREARVQAAHGNTSLMFARTLVPQLKGEVEANVPRVFACAVLAGPDGGAMSKAWQSPPQIPTVKELEKMSADTGVTVEVSKPYSRQQA
jgi:hypothetical protein